MKQAPLYEQLYMQISSVKAVVGFAHNSLATFSAIMN